METKRNYIVATLLTLFFGGIGLHSHHARASPMDAEHPLFKKNYNF